MLSIAAMFAFLIGIASFFTFGWLLWVGEWWVVVAGFVLAVFGNYALMLPILIGGAVFGLPALSLMERRHLLLPLVLTFCSHVYTHVLVTGWCVAVYIFLLSIVQEPALEAAALWSYGVALAPWQHMAMHEERAGDRTGTLVVAFAGWGYIAMGLLNIWLRWPLLDAVLVFSAIMALGVLAQMVMVWPLLRERESPLHRV